LMGDEQNAIRDTTAIAYLTFWSLINNR
jgi:hypothetical protein